MRKRVAAVIGVLVFTVWAVSAQERMQTTPESPKAKAGHAAMTKGSGDKSDAATIAKAVSAAPPEIGKNATVMASGADGQISR